MLVEGYCDSRFVKVKEIFESQLIHNPESGAAFAVYSDGNPLIDIFGGYQDYKKNIKWKDNTIVNVHSTGKGIAAICLSILVNRNLLDLNKSVSEYWPEFKNNGKEDIQIKTLLSHQAGLYGWEKKMKSLDLLDSSYCADLLANQKPFHPHKEETCYHAMTIGYMINTIVRNITKMTIGKFIYQEFYNKRNLQCFIGTPKEQIKNISFTKNMKNEKIIKKKNDLYTNRAFQNPKIDLAVTHTDNWIQAEIPALNCHSNARSLARIYSLFVNIENKKESLVNKDTIERVVKVESSKIDYVLRVPIKWSPIGFIIGGGKIFGNNNRAFGHTGSGGSLAFADPDLKLAISYTPNYLSNNIINDSRAVSMITEVYKNL